MRSMLFVPGDSSRKYERAREGKASALILDLEDSVVAEKKDEARQLTRTMLSNQRGPQQIYVRVSACLNSCPTAKSSKYSPGM